MEVETVRMNLCLQVYAAIQRRLQACMRHAASQIGHAHTKLIGHDKMI